MSINKMRVDGSTKLLFFITKTRTSNVPKHNKDVQELQVVFLYSAEIIIYAMISCFQSDIREVDIKNTIK